MNAARRSSVSISWESHYPDSQLAPPFSPKSDLSSRFLGVPGAQPLWMHQGTALTAHRLCEEPSRVLHSLAPFFHPHQPGLPHHHLCPWKEEPLLQPSHAFPLGRRHHAHPVPATFIYKSLCFQNELNFDFVFRYARRHILFICGQ